METKECKIHGIMPKTLEYFQFYKNGYCWCKQCRNTYARKKGLEDIQNLGENYVQNKLIQRIKFNTGETLLAKQLSKDLIELERLSIIKSRQPKYSFENKNFVNIRSLAKYIEDKYNIKHRTIEWRLRNGYSLSELIVQKRRYFQVKRKRYIVNNLEFSTLKEISNHFLLNHSTLINNLYKDKNLEETVNYLLCKKQQ